jgi:hypothetical protein
MTITVGIIKGGDEGRVKYYLERAALCSGHRSKEGAENALGSYYATGKEQYVGQPNGGGRWMGRGTRALGLDAQYVIPESFAAAVLKGNLDGVDRAEPVLRTCPLGRVAAEPFAADLRRLASIGPQIARMPHQLDDAGLAKYDDHGWRHRPTAPTLSRSPASSPTRIAATPTSVNCGLVV